MKCFRELDPDADVIPLYVARNRSNLQSITFDSIDVSVLLTKLERLTDQVAMLQTGLEAQTTVTQNIKELNDNAVSWIHRLETNQHNASTVKNVSMCTYVPHSKLKSFIKNFQHNITPNNGRLQCRLKGRPQYLAGVPLLNSPQHKHWPTGPAHFSDRRASTGQYSVSFTGPAGPPS